MEACLFCGIVAGDDRAWPFDPLETGELGVDPAITVMSIASRFQLSARQSTP
jgi:hypothetical protein